MTVKTKETAIVRACCEWLTIQGYVFLRDAKSVASVNTENIRGVFWRNNSRVIASDYKGRRSFTRFGVPGQPDIFVLRKGKTPVGIECKTETGKLTTAQSDYGVLLEGLGGYYVVARSIDDLEAEKDIFVN